MVETRLNKILSNSYWELQDLADSQLNLPL